MDASSSERGQKWLTELLNLAGMPSSVNVEPDPPFSEDSCWITIDEANLTPEQIECLVGPDGHVLDSIQYLMNSILNLGQSADKQGAFTVELAGYRLRRYSELKKLAEYAAEKVRETGEEFEIKALSSAERRQMHTMLKAYEDLETYSRGQEPDRRLVVRLLQGEPE
jgi:spoIIIJ-associated protein